MCRKILPKQGNLWQKVMNNYKRLANSKVVVLKAVSKIGFEMFFTDREMMWFHSRLIYIINIRLLRWEAKAT